MSCKQSSVSSQTLNPGSPSSLISNLNDSIFNNLSVDYFPVVIMVKSIRPEVIEVLKDEDVWKFSECYKTNIRIHCSTKDVSEKLIIRLTEENFSFRVDYSGFISHPGSLFVKYLSSDLATEHRLHEYFNGLSKFKSLNEINILKGKGNETCAILKFGIHMDCDYLIRYVKPVPNHFNANPQTPLYLNKYVNRKERTLWSSSDDSSSVSSLDSNEPYEINHNIYDSIIVENLNNFFGDRDISMDTFRKFISKISSFADIEHIYFPVKATSDKQSLKLEGFGYICFNHVENLNNKVLNSLYCLSGKTFEEFMDFDENLVNYNFDDMDDDEEGSMGDNDSFDELDERSRSRGIKISINQHKFNHYLYKAKPHSACLVIKPQLAIHYLSIQGHNFVVSKFSSYVNYQETNLYVNNLSVLFKNDDSLWETFWNQFGSINSAKIIKPDFYSKSSSSNYGKIGFIFYRSFKMALRAILRTNNKQICFNKQSLTIESSFAIQKSESSKNTSRSIDMGQFYYYPTPMMPPPMPPMMYPIPTMPIGYINPYYYINDPYPRNKFQAGNSFVTSPEYESYLGFDIDERADLSIN